MTMQEKSYPYDRILMLNALDDLFRHIGARILSSESADGVVEVSVPGKKGSTCFCFRVHGEDGSSSLCIKTAGNARAGSSEELEEECRAVHGLFAQIDRLLRESAGTNT